MDAWSHETPILLILSPDARVEAELPGLLADPGIRHVAFPPLWALDKAGVDLAEALPGCRSVSLETLEEVLGTLIRLCDAGQLDALVRKTWQQVDERVRHHYLELGAGSALASLLKLGKNTRAIEPPPMFVRDRVAENGFDVQYRLEAGAEPFDWTAPAHEGTLTVFPFDPAGAATREEQGVGAGSGTVIEVFAYNAGRERHRAYWQGVADAKGWTLHDARG
ncbi:MAG: hypothetical protein P1V36_02835 [Planctomycetota bacterium]|nr:hypothetical protein [Planctomycetota bacterium]